MNKLNLYIIRESLDMVLRIYLFIFFSSLANVDCSQNEILHAKCSIVSTMAFIKRRKYGSSKIYYACTCIERMNGNGDTMPMLEDKIVVRKTTCSAKKKIGWEPPMLGICFEMKESFSFHSSPFIGEIIWKIIFFCIQIFCGKVQKLLNLTAPPPPHHHHHHISLRFYYHIFRMHIFFSRLPKVIPTKE